MLSPPQNPFNVVTYSIIGDDNSPALFNINAGSGLISIASSSLASDPKSSHFVRNLYDNLFEQFLKSQNDDNKTEVVW